ncbi:hypothetical protein T484DRAFT_1781883, partial [Baffinella frigidus]
MYMIDIRDGVIDATLVGNAGRFINQPCDGEEANFRPQAFRASAVAGNTAPER